MRLNKQFLPYLLIILFSQSMVAQVEIEKPGLRTVLQDLEERYDVSFEYIDQNISAIYLAPPPKTLTLKQTLDYLTENTGLVYRQLDQRFVTISKPESDSYRICGVLVDELDGEKIPGATVQVGNKMTVTDDQGAFVLAGLPGNGEVIFQSLGYQKLSLSVRSLSQMPCKPIQVTPQVKTLPGVIVRNFITQGISKKIDGSFTINSENQGILPGLIEPDVLQTIQALPGIQSIDETVSNINVRGGTHDQNLVLWDGTKMYQSGHFFGLISAFNPYLTKDVSLIKNGTSAFYNDGVSSTFDIRSDDQVAKEISGGAGINWINADIHAHIPISEKISIQASARRSLADVFQTPTYDQYFERAFRGTEVISNKGDTVVNTDENFYFFDYSFKLLYDISSKDKIRINFLNVYNDIEYQENAQANNQVESRTSGLIQKNLASSIWYERRWSEKLITRAQWYVSSYDLRAVNFDIFNDQRLIQENEVLDSGLKIDALLSIGSNVNFNTGYQFFEVGISNLEDINNPSFRRYIKEVIRTHALFAELNANSKSGKTSLRAGVRGNYIEKFDKYIIEPRLSLNQQISDRLSFQLLGEMKSQTATQIIDFQNDFLGIENRRWVLSDDDAIPIVESQQISGGLDYIKNGLLISLEGYYKYVKGITTSSQGFQDQFQFVRSFGNYQVSGLDFLINKKFEKFSSWLSYSYADNTYEFANLTPSVFPNNLDITHTAVLGFSYQSKHLSLSTGANWHTGKPFTKPVEGDELLGNAINYWEPNSSRLDDYMRVDMSATYRFLLNHRVNMTVGASVWNILDRKNVVDTYYQLNDDNEAELVQQQSLGLTPNFMIRVNF